MGNGKQIRQVVGVGGSRLDRWLTGVLASRGVSREQVKGWMRAGQVRVDGEVCRQPDRQLAAGERVEVIISCVEPRQYERITDELWTLEVVYRDASLLVLDKPAGLAVHPAPGLLENTLAHWLVSHYPELGGFDPVRPGIVHRLDKNTSGLLVVALNETVRLGLVAAFAARRVVKEYLTLVWGVPEKIAGEINVPLGRHPKLKTRMAVVAEGGRPAYTRWRVLWSDRRAGSGVGIALLAVRLHTGRTHQIRVHLQHIGYPIVGDPIYNRSGGKQARDPLLKRLVRRQLLHAWRLAFQHPQSGATLFFSSPPPRDFERALLRLTRQTQRVVVTGLPGSGKSSVLMQLAEAGIPRWSADATVRELYAARAYGWELLQRRFGERFVLPGLAGVDRRALREAMEAEPWVRREVEELIHPLVLHCLEEFWVARAGHRVAVAEVPLFLESKKTVAWNRESQDKASPLVVGIYCSQAVRAERLAQWRGWTAKNLKCVDSWQWPEAYKLRCCHLILNNVGDTIALAHRTAALLRVLAWLRRRQVQHLLAIWRKIWEN